VENFQAGKGLTGLDEHQVRRSTSWYRWVALATLAAAVLTIAAALERARTSGPPDQIPPTRNEIAHLLSGMMIGPALDASHRMRWSRWRRRHQHRARACHYQRQITPRPGNITIYGWSIRKRNDFAAEHVDGRRGSALAGAC
jgi:hypothetical protein